MFSFHLPLTNIWIVCSYLGCGFSTVSISLVPHQIFKESCDLSGEHGQVEEAGGDLIVVLGQVAVPQVLQNLNVLFFVFHVGWKKKDTQAKSEHKQRVKSHLKCADNLKETCSGGMGLL